MTDSLAAVVLAAGKSTRFKSRRVKILHPVAGIPMIRYTLDAVARLGATRVVVVLGQQAGQVTPLLAGRTPPVETCLQLEQLGTGHALLQARGLLEGACDTVLCLYGDMPLLSGETIGALYHRHHQAGAALSLLTVVNPQSMGFGRIVRGKDGRVARIVEEDQATAQERAITELNVGVYCFDAAWLWPRLAALPLSPRGEFFLTDLVGVAVAEGQRVESLAAPSLDEVLGVNTREQMARVEQVARDRVRRRLMADGVTLLDPGATYVDASVQVGADTVIYPGTILEGSTRVGRDCVLGPGTHLVDSVVGDGCRIVSSLLESAVVEDDVQVGPFSHLRPGAVVRSGARVGNFAEVKNSELGAGSHMGHFSYLGDATVGERVNVSAGVITCNFDGREKHRTEVGDDVFLGSDTLLVAPVKVGKGARTGAGAVVTHDVADGDLVVGVPARRREPSGGRGEA
jgi:bifunctional UDP-N-acetylglucosamine pyrophosphorylase/glucosamine-1-phosphate N-acetyltransferase